MIAWLLLLAAIAALVAGTVLLWRADAAGVGTEHPEPRAVAAGTNNIPRSGTRPRRRMRTPPPTATSNYHRRRLPQQTSAPRRNATGAADRRLGPS